MSIKATRKLKKSDIRCTRDLLIFFWFIDDLATINNGGEFERSYREIYAPEFELKKENIDFSKGLLLSFGNQNCT